MIKLFGSVLIMFSTVTTALMSIMGLRDRERTLDAVISALSVMKAEICTNMTPMSDALQKLAGDFGNEPGRFFSDVYFQMRELADKSFAEIWSSAAKNAFCGVLNEGEITAICSLGIHLGKYDISWQEEAITRALNELKRCHVEAAEKRKRDSKLYAVFGAAAGMTAIIIFI